MNRLDGRALHGRLIFDNKRFRAGVLGALLGVLLVATGCNYISSNKPPGAFLGRTRAYDYSPSAIQIGSKQQFWWCGEATNPSLASQSTDTILYSSIDVTNQSPSAPIVVLAETPGAWDSAFTCNPKVIGGVFANPLGDGITYSYASHFEPPKWLGGKTKSMG